MRPSGWAPCKALGATAKRLADETIEATAEYFNMHGIATQIIVSAENVATVRTYARSDASFLSLSKEQIKVSP